MMNPNLTKFFSHTISAQTKITGNFAKLYLPSKIIVSTEYVSKIISKIVTTDIFFHFWHNKHALF